MTKHTRTAMMAVAAAILTGVVSITAVGDLPAPAKTRWTAVEVLPLTCAQAWVLGGKTYAGMLSIVKTDAQISLYNRVLTFPDTREAGIEGGKAIGEDCKADPNGLLYAIVDKHVRRIAEAAAAE